MTQPPTFAESRRTRSTKPRPSRRGVVLAVVLAGMVLLLLMLGALARRVIIEHRAIDAQAQSLEADWLLWSAKHRATLQLQTGKTEATEWKMAPRDPALGKQVVARLLVDDANPTTSKLELQWTAPSGIVIERTAQIAIPAKTTKENSP